MPTARAKKVAVKGTKAAKVKKPTAKQIKETRERLQAFLDVGAKKLKEDMEFLNSAKIDHKDKCPTCRCANSRQFEEPVYSLQDLEHQLSYSLNPDTINDDDFGW